MLGGGVGGEGRPRSNDRGSNGAAAPAARGAPARTVPIRKSPIDWAGLISNRKTPPSEWDPCIPRRDDSDRWFLSVSDLHEKYTSKCPRSEYLKLPNRSLKLVLKLDLERSICDVVAGTQKTLFKALDDVDEHGWIEVVPGKYVRLEILANFAEGDHLDAGSKKLEDGSFFIGR